MQLDRVFVVAVLHNDVQMGINLKKYIFLCLCLCLTTSTYTK